MPGRFYAGRSAEARRAERRQRLLDSALALFGEAGYPATSIERVCAAAGVSTRNFYEEFPSRAALLTTVHDRVSRQLLSAVTTALAATAGEPFDRRIAASATAYLTVIGTDPRTARLSYVEIMGVDEEVERHRLRWRERWVALYCAEAQWSDPDSQDVRWGALALLGAMRELGYEWSRSPEGRSLEDVVEQIVRLARCTLRPA
ncbi:hypothetical protein BAY61_21105 [Prauserella marina]|uniref:DNA-binding transcriptional regulator, AcrR family n=1 Tax=Prauserella marina TaxID=530584 RepID=A0A222VT18_9PSEU|nr:TetR/AcrR family transcriptional regulator [Prauserella marina]ASR37067.1 hypothetical protein BAY61_21105 [Prauserella marina]PWV79949.1 TetR family transcriptional regulator [Prauserella marina]SDD86399.1 DNA-binding transcriptional regulator, AcrR family [Prauserella marina]